MAGISSLGVAVSGMNAAQAGLYVTGHNMSNVATAGFSRQQVMQHDFMSLNIGRSGNGMMQVGLGVDITAIRQVRDKFLDESYRSEVKRAAYYDVKISAGREIETIIGELEGDYRTQKIIQDMKDALNELTLYLPGIETRGNFINTAVTFITKANNIGQRLAEYQYNLDEQVRDTVYQVNALVEEVRLCNKIIAEAQASGDRPNDYLDKRNLALDKLASIVDITATTRLDGMVDIMCEGKELLVSNIASKLGLRYTSKDYPFVEPVFTQSDKILSYSSTAEPLYNLVGKVNAENNNDAGKLKGLLVTRGYYPANYTSISGVPPKNTVWPAAPTAPAQAGYNFPADIGLYNADYMAYQEELKKFNAYTAFENKYGPDDGTPNSGSKNVQFQKDVFNSNYSFIPRVQKEFDELVHNIVEMINEAVAPTKPPFVVTDAGDVINNTPMVDQGLLNGGPVNNNLVKNPFYTGPYALDKQTQGIEVFSRKYALNRFDPVTGEYIPEDPADFSSLYTAGYIVINPEFSTADGYTKLCLSRSGDVEDTAVVKELLNTWDKNFLGRTGHSVDKAYKEFVTNIATETREASTYYDSQMKIVNKTENMRQAMSGVALDEEMTNMMKYQHAYNSSARILNVIDGMLDTIVNRTGRTGL